MIGFLRGRLAEKEPPFLVVDVNGVGYELEAPMSTIFVLPDVGREVQLQRSPRPRGVRYRSRPR